MPNEIELKEETKRVKNLPNKIYLNLGDLEGAKDVDFNEIESEVSWCADKIDETDVPYFRKGKVADFQTKLATLEAENARLISQLRLYQLKEASDILRNAWGYVEDTECYTNFRVLRQDEDEETAQALDILDNLEGLVKAEIKELEKEIEGK